MLESSLSAIFVRTLFVFDVNRPIFRFGIPGARLSKYDILWCQRQYCSSKWPIVYIISKKYSQSIVTSHARNCDGLCVIVVTKPHSLIITAVLKFSFQIVPCLF